ncbi:MAG: hypothetical protein Kow0068_07670 [Marinilabiliales bacterium]
MRHGHPFIRNISSEEYNNHPQNWVVIQDSAGIMYFGNNQGVIEYDGTSYRKLPLYDVRCFQKDKNGTIYLGADNEFGFLYRDTLGKLKYHSLVDSLPDNDKDFYIVLSILTVNDKIYFIGFKKIIIFKNNRFEKSIPTNTDFRFGFKLNNRLFVKETGKGINEIVDDTLSLIKSSGLLADQSIYFILPFSDSLAILGTRDKGLYTMSLDDNHIINPFKTNADDYIKNKTLYHGIQINDSLYGLVTNAGGFIIINKKGEVINMITTKSGLDNQSLNYAYIDRDKNLWLAGNKGIAYVEINIPVYIINENDGISDLAVSFARFRNNIYTGTLQYLHVLRNKNIITKNDYSNFYFAKVSEETESFMAMHVYKGYLIMAARSGILSYDGYELKYIGDNFQNYTIVPSYVDSSVLYIGNNQGILKYKFENGEWTNMGYKLFIGDQIRSFFELPDGEIIFVLRDSILNRSITTNDSVYYVKIEPKGLIKEKKKTTFSIFSCNNEHYLLTERQVFLYDNYNDKFNIITDFEKTIYKDTVYFNGIYKAFNNNLWGSSNKGLFLINRNQHNKSKNFDYKTFTKKSLSSGIFTLYDDSVNNELWISTTQGIYCYSYKYDPEINKDFNILIRTVVINNDSVVSYGNNNISNISINYKNNSISFYYSAPFFTDPEDVKYSYKLDGFNDNWSEWDTENKAIYTNLAPGNYIFRVKARNYLGVDSNEAIFEFEILNPWYLKWWAYIIYFILFVSFIILVVYLYTRRLRATNLKLEKIIEERTKEIREKNLTLESQNKLITDSINYAKHIQDALLPDINNIKSHFSDAFIFYKPRDIVSGDFYWYSQQNNNVYLAVGDCTGHGVPGALMSMMGNTLLNHIVNEQKTEDPGEILKKLNHNVRLMLQQDSDGFNNQDGMDISIVKFNKEKNLLTIASANHKVILIQNEKIIEVAGDIYSVGGLFSDNESVAYRNFDFNINENTFVYLFTDGFADQFGGDDNQKYMLSRFKDFIYKNHKLSFPEQKEMLEKEFSNWKMNNQQIDDVLIIGIKI